MKISILSFLGVLAICGLAKAGGADAVPDKLSTILVAGEDWKEAAGSLSFSDGLCTDAQGNVIFCQMRGKPPAIFKLAPDGTLTKLAEGSRSGNRLGPDGRLYCVGTNEAVAYDLATGAATVLATKVSTNDIAVSSKGFLYLTEPAKKQITMIDPRTKEAKAAGTGISSPNGIALSPDQNTLYVSDYAGLSVFSFTVLPDGNLADKKAAITMKAPENKPTSASGDGMTVDSAGRVYVTTALGVQVFSPAGEALGIIPKPKPGSMISATFGGKDLDYLYVSCTDSIYRRKMQTKGVLAFQPPMTAGEKK